MNAWISDCKPLFMAAMKSRRPESSWRPLILFLVGLIVLAVVALSFTRLPLWQALCFGLGMPLGVAGIMLVLFFLSGAGTQNRPLHAQLVPRLTQLLRRTLLLLWSATLLAWALVALAVPHGGIVLLCANAFLLAMAWPGIGFYLFIVSVTVLQRIDAWLLGWFARPGVLAAALVLSVVATAVMIRRTFPASGREPSGLLASGDVVLAGPKAGEHGSRQHQAPWSPRFLRSWLLAHDLKRQVPAELMLHATAPDQHRYGSLLSTLGMALLAFVIVAVFYAVWPSAQIAQNHLLEAVVWICVASVPFSVAYRQAIVINQSAGEQALFKLAPLSPPAPAFNRVLAAALVRIQLRQWLVSVVVMLGFSYWRGMSGTGMLRELALMLAMLAFVGWPLRDYAGKQGPARWKVALFSSAMLALTLFVMKGVEYTPWWLLAPAAASSAFVVQRWRRMVRAPAAFPAGRLQA